MPFSAVAPTVMPPFIIASVAPWTGSCKNEDNFPTYHPHTIGNRCPALHMIFGCQDTEQYDVLGRPDHLQCWLLGWGHKEKLGAGDCNCFVGSRVTLCYICEVVSWQWLSLVTEEGWGTGHGLLGNQGPAPHWFFIQWLLSLQGKQNTISPHPVTIHHFASGECSPVITWHQASPGSCQKSLSPSIPSAAATQRCLWQVFIPGLSAFPMSGSHFCVFSNPQCLAFPCAWALKSYLETMQTPRVWEPALAAGRGQPSCPQGKNRWLSMHSELTGIQRPPGRRRGQQRRQPAALALLLQYMLKEWCIFGMPQGHKHLPSLS